MSTLLRNPADYINPQFRQRLLETKVGQICPRLERLVIARSTDTINTVFSRLLDNRIMAVPLLDVTTNKYVAFIDLFDILAYLVEVLNLPMAQGEEWMMSSQFRNTSCLTLVGRSPRSAWRLISAEAPLQAAINELKGVHRLAVVDATGNLVSVISQYRIVRWLAARADWAIGDLANMTVEDFGLGYKSEVVTISKNERAVDAFMTMYKRNVSGVAVVDELGTVIGNISVSDLKEINYSATSFRNLYLTNAEFINRKQFGFTWRNLVWVDRYDTIKHVLEQYRDHRVHRVYVVSVGSRQPIGVITLTDIMELFAAATLTA